MTKNNNWFLKVDSQEMRVYPIQLNLDEDGSLGLSELYKEVDCSMVERMRLGQNLELWFDEEGLWTSKNAFVLGGGYASIRGNAIMAMTDWTDDGAVSVGWVCKEDVPLIHISDWVIIDDPSDII